jgi:dTDP-4-amino-4,6-dideoxygalactose transaminase
LSASTDVSEVPFSRPDLADQEARAVAEVLASGWITQGAQVARFEQAFAARVGSETAVATSSCTTALHLALKLVGVGPGDEVICPSYSFVATANAVLHAGATPVFADILPDTWNIDPADALSKVTTRTKAVVPVHQIGLPADLDAFKPFADRGLAIVEDAACAVGARYRGAPIGSHGHIACFSFHPRKILTTGEGGMLTTADQTLADRARQLRSHGASISDHVRHGAKGVIFEEYRELGYNYRMTDMQAAIGLVQLEKLDHLLAERRARAERYDEAFRPFTSVQVPASPPYAERAYQSYAIRLLPSCPIDRDQLLRELAAEGISCRRGIAPIHREPLYRDRSRNVSLPATDEVSARSLFLPIHASLSDTDQTRVIEAVVRRLR